MRKCLFCKIAKKEVFSEVIRENENFLAFKDIRPKAPIHILIIPKMHLGPIHGLNERDGKMLGDLILEAKKVARKLGVAKEGFRLIFNVGRGAGMEISHLHLHLLAGKKLIF